MLPPQVRAPRRCSGLDYQGAVTLMGAHAPLNFSHLAQFLAKAPRFGILYEPQNPKRSA